MAEKRAKRSEGEQRKKRHLQFDQQSWTEIDAEGTDSEMAEGRQATDPFYTPLVNEAAERRLKKEREERSKQQGEKKRT